MGKLLLIFCALCSGLSASVVSGVAILNGQSNHAGIKVRFIQASPTAVSDSVLTDPSGDYSVNLAGGIYQCSFSKNGYQTIYFNNNALLLVSSATVLAAQTLFTGTTVPVSGNVSGSWQGASTYIVNGNIVVPQNQTLTIGPGVSVKFNGNYSLTVLGSLQASGTANNPVAFTSAAVTAPAADWRGIFAGNGAEVFLNYCLVEKCETGVFLDHSIGRIENSEFRYFSGTGISLNFSSSSVLSNSIRDYTISNYARGLVAYSGQVKVECNSFFNGNGSGINCQSDGNYSHNIIHDLTGLGISCSAFTTAKIENNFIHHCDWGIRVGESVQTTVEPVIVNNTIWKNNSGIVLPTYYARPTIINNLIVENEIGISQSGCSFCANTPSTVTHNNVWNNSIANYSGLAIPAVGQTVGLNSNGTAMDSYYNISDNPLFLALSEPHLSVNSPCKNAGLAAYNTLIGCNPALMCKDLVTGVQERDWFSKVEILPNPFSEKLQLKLITDSKADVLITAMSGQPYFSGVANSKGNVMEIETAGWPAGLYLIRIQTDNGTQTLKLVKE